MAATDASPFDTRERAADAIASGRVARPRRIGALYSHFVAFLKLTLPMIAVALLLIVIWRFIMRLRRRHIDPVIEDIQENIDDVVTGASEATEDVRSGISGFFDRMAGRKRPAKQPAKQNGSTQQR